MCRVWGGVGKAGGVGGRSPPTKRKYKGFEMARVRGVGCVGYLELRVSRVTRV